VILRVYDGTTDWSEYLAHFKSVARVQNWDEEQQAGMLCTSLAGSVLSVLDTLPEAKLRCFKSVTAAIRKSFCPAELIHLHQAELKGRRRKPHESLGELGRDIGKKIRLAFPGADMATREYMGISHFVEAFAGTDSELRLHVIKAHPTTLEEAIGVATEIDAVLQAENLNHPSRRRGDVRVVSDGTYEDDFRSEMRKMKEELEAARRELNDLRRKPSQAPRKSRQDIECYGCGRKGHYKRDCPSATPKQSEN
jgi:hypothetical protein